MVDGSKGAQRVSHDEEYDQGPRAIRHPYTPGQGHDAVPMRGEGVDPGQLDQRKRKDDEGLHEVPPPHLLGAGRVGARQADLLGEVAHDGKGAGGVDHEEGVVDVGKDVAVALAVPPGRRVVGAPDEGVGDGEAVEEEGGGDEDDGGEFAVAGEDAEGHDDGEVGEDAEDDAGY